MERSRHISQDRSGPHEAGRKQHKSMGIHQTQWQRLKGTCLRYTMLPGTANVLLILFDCVLLRSIF